MTRLTKPVRRVLEHYERGRPCTVKIAREGLYIRRLGERETGPGCYFLSWRGVYFHACAATTRERKREKLAEKKRKAQEAKELRELFAAKK